MKLNDNELVIMCAQCGTIEMMKLLQKNGMSLKEEGPMYSKDLTYRIITTVIGAATFYRRHEMLKYLVPLVGKE